MGGVDKGLQRHHGLPLVAHALQRLRPQVGTLALSANRHLEAYAAHGVPVWPDELPDHPGPLAGWLTALRRATTPWVASVPCDTPGFPDDLVARLAEAVQRAEGLRRGAEEGPHAPRVGAAPEGLVEGGAVDEFAGEEGPAGVFGVGRGEAEIMHPRDGRQVELRQDLELVHQPLRERRLRVREQALEHHGGAAGEAVLDEPDAAAAAFSHPSEHPVTVC